MGPAASHFAADRPRLIGGAHWRVLDRHYNACCSYYLPAEDSKRVSASQADVILAQLMGRPLVADPFPLYRELREIDPVHREENGVWYLSRYGDCERVLRSNEFGHFGLGERLVGEAADSLSMRLVALMFSHDDPPEHTRKRGRVAGVFSPKVIDGYGQTVAALLRTLIDELGGESEVDLDERLSARLPVLVTCEFLGIPDEDQDQCVGWVGDITSSNQPVVPSSLRARADEAADAACRYFAELLKVRERRPREDIISELARGGTGPDAIEEAVATVVLLMAAGFETTRYTISGGIAELASRPRQWNRARSQVDEQGSITANALEELLRHQGPIHGAIPRLSRSAQAFGDTVIPAGELVVAMVAAGNRDPTVFADPDELDVDQAGRRALSLGAGVHYCLGAALAKLEISHAVSAVISAFPDLAVLEPPTVKGSFNVRGPGGLLVSLGGTRS
jgi:cytochrome P450